MKIVDKPWGREIWWAHAKGKYMGKTLEISDGHRLSLQLHREKDETIYVLSGKLRIYSGQSIQNIQSKVYVANETITLSPGTIHRMEGEEDCVYLEASTPQMDDVVRIEDDYNRAEKK